MDKLVVSSRETRLQFLQALTEIQEYVNFRSNSGMYDICDVCGNNDMNTIFEQRDVFTLM